jgi:hypothetical protein
LQEINLLFEQMGFNARIAMQQAQMQNQAQIAALGAMQKSQYSFGNSLEGVARET